MKVLFSLTVMAILTWGGGSWAQQPELPQNVLRVCADPADLPFSNKAQEGFENRIAEVIAQALGVRLEYYWWPYQRGLVRRTLQEGKCDVLINVPTEYERVLTTKPYYRSTYVLVYKRDRNLQIQSMGDPILQRLKIGVHINTPPHVLLAQNGIVGPNVVGYRLFYDPQFHPEEYPGKLVEDLIAGKLDVVFVWGPIAGYFVKKKGAPLHMEPIQSTDPRIPVAFNFSMGVRKGNKALKALLEKVLDEKRNEIHQILEDYGVPLLPLGGDEPPPTRSLREEPKSRNLSR